MICSIGDIYNDAPPREKKLPSPDYSLDASHTEYGNGNAEYYPGSRIRERQGPNPYTQPLLLY